VCECHLRCPCSHSLRRYYQDHQPI
jgi:hypothetical protein